ncbi:hypothetical protein BGX34_006055, partial [Mortierella sp. NVP85]
MEDEYELYESSSDEDEVEHVTKEKTIVYKPAISEKTNWFRKAAGVGVGAAVGAGLAVGVLKKFGDGLWKRTKTVVNTRKGHVDEKVPIKHAVVYYDEETVYDSVVIDKTTGVSYVTQLIFDSETQVYHVYYRYNETEYILSDSYETIEEAKVAFQDHYKKTFEIEWKDRTTVTSEKYTVEVKTYETYEVVEEIEEVFDEETAQTIITADKEIIPQEQSTTTTVTTTKSGVETIESTVEKIAISDADKEVKVITTHTGVVSKPAVSKETSWFRKLASGAGATAAGALTKVDGVWKRAVQVVSTRKGKVDEKVPLKHACVYYEEDGDVYNAELIEASTGTKYITQLIFDTETQVYYVYYRYGETDFKLDGPHKTIDEAKIAFKDNYKKKTEVEWKERETAVNTKWTYEVQTYETVEVVEEIVEEVDEVEAQEIIKREEVNVGVKGTTTEVVIVKDKVEVTKPAVSKKASWLRRVAHDVGEAASDVAHGAGKVAKGIAIGAGVVTAGAVVGTGLAAHHALKKVDGVWKRAVQVITTHKAKVDEKAPVKHAYVYYDEDVYDSVVVDAKTGNKHVTQLLFDSEKEVYYVYYRWNETEYTLSDSYETVEEAKAAYLIQYKKNFDIEWTERTTVVSEKWTIEHQVYE